MKKCIRMNEKAWLRLASKSTQVLLSSSHVNIYNNECFDIIEKLVEIFRNIFKVLLLFIISTKRIELEGRVLTYLASETKTEKEVESLKKSKYRQQYYYFVDEGSANFTSVKQLQGRLGCKDFMVLIKNGCAVFKEYQLLAAANNYSGFFDKLMLLSRYVSCLMLLRSLAVGLFSSRPTKVVNFFSGSYFGSSLNSACNLLKIDYYSYVWGSNIKAREQMHSEVGCLLLKSKYDAIPYQERSDFINLTPTVVGNLAFDRKIMKSTRPKFDVLLIDTCYSRTFGFNEKMDLYVRLFSIFKVYGFNKVCVKAHPGSNLTDLNEILTSVDWASISLFSGLEIKLDSLYGDANIIININSTEILYLRYCALQVVNLFPYFLKKYNGKELGDYAQFCETNLIDIHSIEDLYKNWPEYMAQNINPDEEFKDDGVTSANNLGMIIEKIK